MATDGDLHQAHSTDRGFLPSRASLVLIAFLLIGGALLFTEHRAHLLGALPYLLLPACLLMHVFMHGGHGGHGGHRHSHRDLDKGHETPVKENVND